MRQRNLSRDQMEKRIANLLRNFTPHRSLSDLPFLQELTFATAAGMLVGEGRRGNSAEREKEESDEHYRSKTLTASLLIVVLGVQGVNFTQQDWKINLYS